MRVGGTVRIDLREVPEDRLDYVVKSATYAPTGADVILFVRHDQFVWSGMDYIRRHGQHLRSVHVEADDPDTIRRWVAVLRGEAE